MSYTVLSKHLQLAQSSDRYKNIYFIWEFIILQKKTCHMENQRIAKTECNKVLKGIYWVPKFTDQITEHTRKQKHWCWMVLAFKWAKPWLGFRILRFGSLGYYPCYVEQATLLLSQRYLVLMLKVQSGIRASGQLPARP